MFYIRKAFSLGPLRFNLSKSGVGLSVGVKGLRVGSGPRGPYVHAGREGLYLKRFFNDSPRKRSFAEPRTAPQNGGKIAWDTQNGGKITGGTQNGGKITWDTTVIAVILVALIPFGWVFWATIFAIVMVWFFDRREDNTR